MTKNNKRKKHGISKRWYIRAVLLITMLLTVTAGCFGRRSKPTDNPTTATPEPTEVVTPEPTEAATPKPTEAVTPEPTEEEEATAKSIEVSVAEAVAGLQLDGWSVPSGGLSFTLDESGLAELKKSQRELYDAILVILKITGDGGTAGWEGIPRTKDGNAFTVTISETYVVIVIYDGRKAPSPSPTPTPFIPSGNGGRVTLTGTTADISVAQVGDTVLYGSYEQDNNTGNGEEAIEWFVLDKQDGKLLLLSKYALDCKKYNEEWEAVTWEMCTLRRWLNNTFYTTAFSMTEQGRIVTTRIRNEDNPEYGTRGGNDTEDKVFLLSIGEFLEYFDSDQYYDPVPVCRANVTAYAETQGGRVYSEAEYGGFVIIEYDEDGWWWLRSPGGNSGNAAVVYNRGDVTYGGRSVNYSGNVVRPAFWINLEEGTEKLIPTSKITPTLTSRPTLNPSIDKVFIPSGSGERVTFTENTATLFEAKVGDTVRYGNYEQDNNFGNGVEAIEWLVLDRQDGKLLLLSKYVLDVKSYDEHGSESYVTWETCTLRDWLNGEFYNTAFSPTEQEQIATTWVKNEDNPSWVIKGGNDTEDKVFLLSIGEALNYFDPDPYAEDPARRTKLTEYAKALDYRDSGDGNGWWWLRTPDDCSLGGANVSSSGYIRPRGLDVEDLIYSYGFGVRPTLWLKPQRRSQPLR